MRMREPASTRNDDPAGEGTTGTVLAIAAGGGSAVAETGVVAFGATALLAASSASTD